MEALFADFGLHPNEFADFIEAHGGFVAGGASLHAYSPFVNGHPNDIDVWIPMDSYWTWEILTE